MNKKEYLGKIAAQLNIAFVILLIVTIYEGYYMLNSYSGLSVVLTILSAAITYFAFILKRFFEDMRDN